MLIQMERTAHVFIVDGVKCRLWKAVTERGSPCLVLVHRIAIPDDGTAHPDDEKEFNEQFEEAVTPIEVMIKA